MARRVRKDTWKTKKWYKVMAPTMFDEREIGETPASEPNAILGRRLQTTLKELTGNIRKGSKVKVDFEVESVTGTTAKTRFHSLELVRSYVRSMVRRRVSRIDPIFIVDTKDADKLRIKALLITTRRVRTSIKDALRRETARLIQTAAKERTTDEFVKSIADDAMTKELRTGLHAIYPLKKVEIRKIEALRPKA